MTSIRKFLTPVRILYLGKALEGAAYSSCMPFLLLHFMKTLGMNPVASGVVLSAREMVPIFTALAMGWVVAKTSRKPVLVISLATLSISVLAFKTGWGGKSGLLAAALVSGLAYSSMRIAFSSAVADFTSKEDSVQAFAGLHAAANAGFALGPLLSSYWVARQDYAHAFWVSISLYLLASLCIGVLLPSAEHKGQETSEPGSMRETWLSLGRPGAVLLLATLLVLLVNGIRAQVDMLGMAKYFVDYFGSTRATSLYWTIQSAAVVFLVPLSGRLMKQWPLKSLFSAFCAGSVISAAAYVSLGFFRPEELALGFTVMTALSVIGECLWAPCLGAIIIHLVGKRQSGLMFGISNTVLALGMTLGSSLGGLMLKRAMDLNHLPYYWMALGIICLPSLLAIGLLGFASLRYRIGKREPLGAVIVPLPRGEPA